LRGPAESANGPALEAKGVSDVWITRIARMAVDYGPSDELAGVASRTWGTSGRYLFTRVAIDKGDDTTVQHTRTTPSTCILLAYASDASVCVSQPQHTHASSMQPYTALLIPECPHTTSSGFSERHSATLPSFHTIRGSTLRSHQRRHGTSAVTWVVIRFALLVKQRIHIGNTLASQF
jgi:hypothetical protein